MVASPIQVPVRLSQLAFEEHTVAGGSPAEQLPNPELQSVLTAHRVPLDLPAVHPFTSQSALAVHAVQIGLPAVHVPEPELQSALTAHGVPIGFPAVQLA